MAPRIACPLVGIGASAGGLEACLRFFEAMPPDSGAAFVLVQHLDPKQESITAELLDRRTRMNVGQIEDHPVPRPNHVYVIPPNADLTISEGKLHVRKPVEPRGKRAPIDRFFRSLAAECGNRAIAIVMSGMGADGALGIKSIKEVGGLVIAQKPEDAQHDGMPRAAIRSGMVDLVLPVTEMPKQITTFAQHPYVSAPISAEPAPSKRAQGEAKADQQGGSKEHSPQAARAEGEGGINDESDAFKRILSRLHSDAKFDFSSYRKATISRRIERRMSIRNITSLDEYAAMLEGEPEEVRDLFQDLLISVTRFFRDPDAWTYLKENILPRLCDGLEDGDVVRVWVPGCASGEEAYTLAILLHEFLEDNRTNCDVQIFASDVDEQALEIGRQAKYPDTIREDVSEERLNRFFREVEGDHHYIIAKRIRESVVFAHQNLIGDAPFSRMHLICCRNLLIYLEPALQQQVLKLFNFALHDGGWLMLGSAESVRPDDGTYEAVSTRHRIYRKTGRTPRHDAVFPITRGAGTRRASADFGWSPSSAHRPAFAAGAEGGPHDRFEAWVRQFLVNRYAPASVVVNENLDIIYFVGSTQDYLVQPMGRPTTNLVSMAREGLGLRLERAIEDAREAGRSVTFETHLRRSTDATGWRDRGESAQELTNESEAESTGNQAKTSGSEAQSSGSEAKSSGNERKRSESNGRTSSDRNTSDPMRSAGTTGSFVPIRVTVMPLPRSGPQSESAGEMADLLVTFEDVASPGGGDTETNETSKSGERAIAGGPRAVAHLERELQFARDHIADLQVRLSGRTEEFQAGHEELMSMNEELQSSNEELETSKEELQSLNEELTTVNHQLEQKMRELEQANADLDNLLTSTNIGTIFLDREFRITRFTPAMRQLLNLLPSDIGRPISDFAQAVVDSGMADAVRQVLAKREHVTDEVQSADGRWHLRRILPYYTERGTVEGVVITFTDITERKRSEERNRFLAAVVESSDDAILTKTLDGIITSWNRGAEKLYGYTAEEMIGTPVQRLAPADRPEEISGFLEELRRGETIEHFETVRVCKDGTRKDISLTISPIRSTAGKIIGASAVARDITQRRRIGEALRDSEERYRAIVESQAEMVCRFRPDGTILFANGAYARARGTTPEALEGVNFWEFIDDADREGVRALLDQLTPENPEVSIENRFETSEGVRWTLWTNRGLAFDKEGRATEAQSVGIDITGRKRAEEALREHARTQEILNRVGAVLSAELDMEKLVQAVTDAGTELSGATFGAFFFNAVNEEGESYLLYTLSGAPREAFERFGTPRNTPVFEPTFTGQGIVRSDDITKDPRYGRMAPHHGMPEGHLPVRSYLAVPVMSRSGAVLGGLFFGHPEVGVFTEESERLVRGIAAQAAIAIDNARLYETARESEERFRMLAENMAQLAWTCDQLGNVTWYNKRWLQYTGLSFDEMKNWGWTKCHHPDHVDRVVEGVKHASEAGEIWEDTFPLRGADGEYRWFLSRAVPICDDDGNIVRWFGTNTDITDRLAAEQALRDSERRLRLALDAGRMGTWAWDHATGRVRWSPGLEAIHGLEPGTFDGTFEAFSSDIHPEHRERVLDTINKAIREQEEYRIEYPIVLPDGTERWVEGRGTAQTNIQGDVEGMVGVCMDITERKRAEERQHMLVRELNHRVKNTLSVVNAISSLSLRASDSLEEFGPAFTNRLQALARAHTRFIESESSNIDLTRIVQDEIAPYLLETNSPDVVIDGAVVRPIDDQARTLGLILHEIATNAAKYGALSVSQGRVEVRWSVVPRDDENEWVEFHWIEHNGPPVKRPSRRGFGTDLIERSVVYELEGEVDLMYEPDGFRCHITFPLNRDDGPA